MPQKRKRGQSSSGSGSSGHGQTQAPANLPVLTQKRLERPQDLEDASPVQVDWRKEDWLRKKLNGNMPVITSPVKHQGRMETCVAHSVSTCVEGAYNIKYYNNPKHPAVSLSVQELIDSVQPESSKILETNLKKVFKRMI
ncbi:hypothetical protein LINGRAHAP2_LOCUS30322 [Linum grandiflorum]